MTYPKSWRGAADPASLFLILWRHLNAVARSTVANFIEAPPAVERRFARVLEDGTGAEVVGRLCDLLDELRPKKEAFPAPREAAGLVVCAMQAIDEALLGVHPRGVTPRRSLPEWLQSLREKRLESGAFGVDERYSLIARGPLLRAPRMPDEGGTFRLADQFAALKVIDLEGFVEDGRTLGVSIRVIDESADKGVPTRRDRRGSEMISFVPLAEGSDDLVATVTRDGSTTFLDVRKGKNFDPAAKLARACADCADSDIIVAPELTIDDRDVVEIAAALSAMPGSRPRLVLAGSGLTDALEEGSNLPFNEASVLNGSGATLWTHRKVAAYSMEKETADELDLPAAKGDKKLMERIAWGDEIRIGDVEALGRCLLLICQDVQMTCVTHLLEEFRPDWVLVPILDTGTCCNRWPARRARELAVIGETRFVVVSNLTMSSWRTIPTPAREMGVAIGPARINRNEPGPDSPSIQAQLKPESAARPHATIRWRRSRGWSKY